MSLMLTAVVVCDMCEEKLHIDLDEKEPWESYEEAIIDAAEQAQWFLGDDNEAYCSECYDDTGE